MIPVPVLTMAAVFQWGGSDRQSITPVSVQLATLDLIVKLLSMIATLWQPAQTTACVWIVMMKLTALIIVFVILILCKMEVPGVYKIL